MEDRTERIAKKIIGLYDDFQTEAKIENLLGKVSAIQIVLYPFPLKKSLAVKRANKKIQGPVYPLSKVKKLLNSLRISFKKERGDGRGDPQNMYLTDDEAIDALKKLTSSDYKYSLDKLNRSQQKGRGDNRQVDVYTKLVDTQMGEEFAYIKFCIENESILVISFHPDDRYL